LLNNYGGELRIPVTPSEHPYGTVELAQSAVGMVEQSADFFILKNHGFVAVGVDVDATAAKVLDQYRNLITLL